MLGRRLCGSGGRLRLLARGRLGRLDRSLSFESRLLDRSGTLRLPSLLDLATLLGLLAARCLLARDPLGIRLCSLRLHPFRLESLALRLRFGRTLLVGNAPSVLRLLPQPLRLLPLALSLRLRLRLGLLHRLAQRLGFLRHAHRLQPRLLNRQRRLLSLLLRPLCHRTFCHLGLSEGLALCTFARVLLLCNRGVRGGLGLLCSLLTLAVRRCCTLALFRGRFLALLAALLGIGENFELITHLLL